MSQRPNKDPLQGLKHIAYARSVLLPEEELEYTDLVNYAKWQVCKVRSVLWNDPVWDSYTAEEILIEFFAIRFDEDEDARRKFAASLIKANESDMEWFARMERELQTKQEEKNREEEKKPIEFEDKF